MQGLPHPCGVLHWRMGGGGGGAEVCNVQQVTYATGNIMQYRSVMREFRLQCVN